MIASKASVPTVEGILDGREYRMGISKPVHVMNMLSEQYSDRASSVMREYAVNGRDACIEAGINRPVEISLPTRMRPELRVRDYGVGLGHFEIETIYSQYGESTKTDTNEQTGCLGIGSKSAFALNPTFTVTSIKNGVRIQVVVMRDSEGATMKVVDTSTTSEPSGTEVAIPVPVNRIAEFPIKAQNLFRFWPAGSVVIDGQSPAPITGEWVCDDILATDQCGGQSYAVMGGVPYPVAVDHGLRGYNYSLVMFVPLGSLDFHPSREHVIDTDRTKECLAKFTKRFRDECAKAFQKTLDACPTKADALATLFNKQGIFPKPDVAYTYHGTPFPTAFKLPAEKRQVAKREWRESDNEWVETMVTEEHHPYFTIVPERYSKISASDSIASLRTQEWASTVWFYNWNYAGWSATMRKKLNHWLGGREDADGNERTAMRASLPVSYPEHYVLVESKDDIPAEWLRSGMILDWEATVGQIKLPRKAQTVSGRVPCSYDLICNGEWQYEVEASEIDTDCDIFYCPAISAVYTQTLTEAYPDCYIVPLQSRRVEKFKRLFPEAKDAFTVGQEIKNKILAGITEQQKIAATVQNDGSLERLRTLDADKVDDPMLKLWIRYATADLSSLRSKLRPFSATIPTVDLAKTPLGDNNPIYRYPLFPDAYDLRSLCRTEERKAKAMEHLYLYLNTAYNDLLASV